jgi:hypothetical protein
VEVGTQPFGAGRGSLPHGSLSRYPTSVVRFDPAGQGKDTARSPPSFRVSAGRGGVPGRIWTCDHLTPLSSATTFSQVVAVLGRNAECEQRAQTRRSSTIAPNVRSPAGPQNKRTSPTGFC